MWPSATRLVGKGDGASGVGEGEGDGVSSTGDGTGEAVVADEADFPGEAVVGVALPQLAPTRTKIASAASRIVTCRENAGNRR
jgi:hypothetical protein